MVPVSSEKVWWHEEIDDSASETNVTIRNPCKTGRRCLTKCCLGEGSPKAEHGPNPKLNRHPKYMIINTITPTWILHRWRHEARRLSWVSGTWQWCGNVLWGVWVPFKENWMHNYQTGRLIVMCINEWMHALHNNAGTWMFTFWAVTRSLSTRRSSPTTPLPILFYPEILQTTCRINSLLGLDCLYRMRSQGWLKKSYTDGDLRSWIDASLPFHLIEVDCLLEVSWNLSFLNWSLLRHRWDWKDG